jgi:hypothetical protein
VRASWLLQVRGVPKYSCDVRLSVRRLLAPAIVIGADGLPGLEQNFAAAAFLQPLPEVFAERVAIGAQ